MITKEQFKKEVEEFAMIHASEYCYNEPTVEIRNFDPEERVAEATITIQLWPTGTQKEGYVFEVPISLHEGEPAIEAVSDPEFHLDLNGEGLYTYLFLEACSRLEELTRGK